MEVFMKKLFLVLTLVMVLGLVGCGSSWKADTFIKNNDPFFDLKLTTSDCISYTLVVTSKTQKDAEIVWEKTYYIDETNATNGGFMFGNETYYEDKDKPKTPSIIFANDSLTKTIYPSYLAYWKRGWVFGYLPRGRIGAYLTLRANGEEVGHRLYLNITY